MTDALERPLASPVMPGHCTGVPTSSQIRDRWPDTKVLVPLQGADRQTLFASIRAGALACLPAEVSAGRLVQAVQSVAAGQSLIDPAVTAPLMEQVRRSRHTSVDNLARLSADKQRVAGTAGPGPHESGDRAAAGSVCRHGRYDDRGATLVPPNTNQPLAPWKAKLS